MKVYHKAEDYMTKEHIGRLRHSNFMCDVCGAKNLSELDNSKKKEDSIDIYSATRLMRKLPTVLASDMNECELAAYNSLPDKFVGYRGYASLKKIDSDKFYNAQSWTICKWTASVVMSAHETLLKQRVPYYRDGKKINTVLGTKLINKSVVLAVCFRKNEAEIILIKEGK